MGETWKSDHPPGRRNFKSTKGGLDRGVLLYFFSRQSVFLTVLWKQPSKSDERFKPFPKDKILEASILKAFADDRFKFDENERKFVKRVEDTVGKGEIAH